METLTGNELDEILKELEKVSDEIKNTDNGEEKWAVTEKIWLCLPRKNGGISINILNPKIFPVSKRKKLQRECWIW